LKIRACTCRCAGRTAGWISRWASCIRMWGSSRDF
jgi:hypothetical protein